MKKILLVFGTRPEAIKMAPLVNKLKMEDAENNSQFETRVCDSTHINDGLQESILWYINDIKGDKQ